MSSLSFDGGALRLQTCARTSLLGRRNAQIANRQPRSFRAHATSASASAYLIRGSAVLPEGIRMSLLRRFGLEPADLAVR